MGKHLHIGEKKILANCTECICLPDGTLSCGPTGCPKLECKSPYLLPNECCPKCRKKVLFFFTIIAFKYKFFKLN